MNNFSEEIGIKLSKNRLSRNMTLNEVSAKTEELGCYIQPSSLSRIENGQQRIYADQLITLCKIYECSLGSTVTVCSDLDEQISAAIQTEPIEIKKTVLWCIKEWHGNTTALWKFMGLYISMPPKIRQMIAGMGISTYNYAKQTNQINKSAPPVDIAYITKEYRKLLD